VQDGYTVTPLSGLGFNECAITAGPVMRNLKSNKEEIS
jgi:hypothetical protein